MAGFAMGAGGGALVTGAGRSGAWTAGIAGTSSVFAASYRGISAMLHPRKSGPTERRLVGPHRGGIGFGEERAYLPPQLVLDDVDLSTRVEDAESKFVGHRCVLAQQRSLVGAEALVDVVAELHVHPGFPVVHAARLQDAA